MFYERRHKKKSKIHVIWITEKKIKQQNRINPKDGNSKNYPATTTTTQALTVKYHRMDSGHWSWCLWLGFKFVLVFIVCLTGSGITQETHLWAYLWRNLQRYAGRRKPHPSCGSHQPTDWTPILNQKEKSLNTGIRFSLLPIHQWTQCGQLPGFSGLMPSTMKDYIPQSGQSKPCLP